MAKIVVNKRILWVDDDKQLLAGYREELVEQGFDVDFVDNLNEAVKKVQDPFREYHIVIWDSLMPPGDGTLLAQGDQRGSFSPANFQRFVKQLRPDAKTVLFTNLRDAVVDWNNPAAGEFAFTKRDYRPWKFAEQLKKILSETIRGPRPNGE